MSTSSNIALGALRLQAQFRSDLENNNAVSIPEWNTYLTNSHKELLDILIGAYGNDYKFALNYPFSITNSQFYPLPDGTSNFQNANGTTAEKFYKLLGVDLQYSASPSGYVTLRRFEFIERNKYAYPNTAVNWNGYSNLRYRLSGDNLEFIPVPMAGQTARIWYIPAPQNLQYILPITMANGGTICSLSDTTGLSIGMNFWYGNSYNQTTTITSIASNSSITLATASNVTNASQICAMWNDATSLDGIAGWEEYIIVDAAIKAQIKQENDIQPLLLQKAELKARIESMAEGRDAGQAHHVSDALGAQAWGYGGMDGGWGMGDY